MSGQLIDIHAWNCFPCQAPCSLLCWWHGADAAVGCCRLRYIIRLQAKLQQGDAVQSVLLTGEINNSTGGRPIIAYLYGPDANQVRFNVLLSSHTDSLLALHAAAEACFFRMGHTHSLKLESRCVE